MRNLKKVLSLTLALVMMLSMMTFAGAAETTKVSTATDLTDMKDVANKEAVSLLVDLKVVAGRDNGAFDPAGSLKRAEFAKLIYVAKMGSDDKAANFVNAATGLTDIAGTWFEGYVNYAFSTGIVSGTSKTTFTPNGLVKVAEAAKMLLVGLGYDAKAEGYTDNALWSVNVMQQAKQSGLLEGIKLGANVALTRDAAAQMVFNALMAKTVSVTYNFDMNGKKYITGAKVNTTTWGEEIFNLQKVEGTVTGISTNGKAIVNGVIINLNADPAVVGCKVVYYKNSSTGKMISSALLASRSTVLATSTDGTAVALLANGDKSEYLASKDANPTYYVNGTQIPYAPSSNGAYWVKNDADGVLYNDSTVVIKPGVIVELIDTDANDKFDVVRVTVKSVDTIGEDGVKITKATSVTKVDAITVDGITALDGTVPAANVFGYEGLKEDDVVLSYKVGNKFYLEKAVSATGSITGMKNDKYTMGGVGYGVSGLVTGSTVTSAIEYNKDMTFFLDNNKTIVKAVLNEKAAASSYAVVLDLVFVPNETAGGNGGQAEAQLLHTDGTLENVKVSTINGMDVKGAGATVEGKYNETTWATNKGAVSFTDHSSAATVAGKAYADDTAGTNAYVALQTVSAGDATNKLEGKVYSYKMVDGKCALTTIKTDETGANDKVETISTTTIVNNKPSLNANVLADNKTIFLVKVVSGSKTTYKSYEGIAKMPTTNSSAAGSAVITANTKLAKVVYIDTGAIATVGTDEIAYITKTTNVGYVPESKADAGDDYFLFPAIVKGEVTTIKVAPNASTGAFTTQSVNKPVFDHLGFVTLTKNTNGIVTSALMTAQYNETINNLNNVDAVVADDATACPGAFVGTAKAANGVLGVKGGSSWAYYTYTSDAKVFYIDNTDGSVVTGTISGIISDSDDEAVVTVLDATPGAGEAYKQSVITGVYIVKKGVNADGATGGDDTVYSKTFTASMAVNAATAKTINLTPTITATAPTVDGDLDGSITYTVKLLNPISGNGYLTQFSTVVAFTDNNQHNQAQALVVTAPGHYVVDWTVTVAGAAVASGTTSDVLIAMK